MTNNLLFDKLVSYYQSIAWQMVRVPNETIISTTYQGKNSSWVFVATSDEPRGIIVLFARYPETCSAEKYSVVSEFLERANFGMTHGAWVMDRHDGEIRYRVGVDMENMKLTNEYIQSLTTYTNMTMEYYLPGIQAILSKNFSPQQAWQMIFA
ncbi:MAG: hypothetical protein AAF652_05800 [Cyanobacteria bacterium P01_C01_bin.72]